MWKNGCKFYDRDTMGDDKGLFVSSQQNPFGNNTYEVQRTYSKVKEPGKTFSVILNND